MNRSSRPRVITIILTWNSADYIENCVRSVVYSDYITDVVVVDNNSADNTRSIVSSAYPNVKIINTGSNLGYAGGNNFAFRALDSNDADYYLILNPDAAIYSNCLSLLVSRMESELNLAACCPIVYQDNKNTIWDAGGSVNWRNGLTPHRGDGQTDTGQFDNTTYTDRVNGCAMLIRKATLNTIGLFDEKFFLYYEETDWSVRAQRAGFRFGFVSAAKAIHAASASTGGAQSPTYEYYLSRNRWYFMSKNRDQANRLYPAWIMYNYAYGLYKTLCSSGWSVCITTFRSQLKGYLDYRRQHYGRQSVR